MLCSNYCIYFVWILFLLPYPLWFLLSKFTGVSTLQWIWFSWRLSPELFVSRSSASESERVEDAGERPQSVALQCPSGKKAPLSFLLNKAEWLWCTAHQTETLRLHARCGNVFTLNISSLLRLSCATFQVSPHPEDEDRRFTLSYYLSDDMISIFEKPTRNTGVIGGKFLKKTRVRKPGTTEENPEFYSPADLAIGNTIEGNLPWLICIILCTHI